MDCKSLYSIWVQTQIILNLFRGDDPPRYPDFQIIVLLIWVLRFHYITDSDNSNVRYNTLIDRNPFSIDIYLTILVTRVTTKTRILTFNLSMETLHRLTLARRSGEGVRFGG